MASLRIAAVALVAVTAAGCGSTVSTTTLAGQAPQGDGLSAPAGVDAGGALAPVTGAETGGTDAGGVALPADGAAPGGGPAVAVPGAAGGGTGGGGSAPGAAGPAAGGASARLPETGPGWDKSYVYIGVATQKDVQQAFETVGVGGLDAGDQEGQAKAVADELNRRGGLYGRRIKLVFRDHATIATAQDPNTTAQATCTYFTQDRPVVAFLNPVTLMDGAPLRSCFAKARVPLFNASLASLDQKATAAYAPYLYASVAPVWDPFVRVLVARLKAQGYFGGWDTRTGTKAPGVAKVGILIKSDDISPRILALITRAVTAAGAPNPESYSFKDGSEMSSAVLQFRGRGVTHVISTDGALLAFMLSADDQGYRPRYALSSFLTPSALLEGVAPPRQLIGSIGVGWSPSVDVADANDPGDTGPGEQECKQMLAKGGQTFAGKRLAEAVAFAFCDGLRLIAAGARAGGGLTGPQITAGVQQAGPKLSSAFGFGNGLGPGRYFLPGAVRDIGYVESCRCFRYSSRTSIPI